MSASSPVRASLTANRKNREANSNQYPNLSQRSPDTDSPNLNQESGRKDHSHNDLKTKL